MKILQICNDYRDKSLYKNLFVNNYENEIKQIVYVPFKKNINIQIDNKYEIIQSKCYRNIDRFLFFYKQKKIFNDLCNKKILNDINLVHAHTLFSNGDIAFRIKQKYGLKYIITVRGTDIDVFYKNLFWLRNRGNEILINASKIIFITPALKKKLLSLIKNKDLVSEINRKSEIISNGIDEFWIKNNRTKHLNNKDSYKLVQVGWINRNKNQLNSIKAIEILNNNGINCTLDIIGNAEYKKDFKYKKKILKLIAKSKNGNKINIINRLEKEELLKKYRKSDILLLPSHRETFGLVYIEAISQGIPYICTNNQAIDGMFNGIGISCDSKNELDIANKIIDIIKNYEVYNKNINLLKIDKFSWKSISKRIKEIYIQSVEEKVNL